MGVDIASLLRKRDTIDLPISGFKRRRPPENSEMSTLNPFSAAQDGWTASDQGDLTSAAKSHYSVARFINVNPHPVLSGMRGDEFTYKSSSRENLYPGSLVFSLRNKSATTSHLMSLFDLNTSMFRAHCKKQTGKSVNKNDAMPYSSPNLFLSKFSFVGAVSHNTNDSLGQIVDYNTKGETRLLNIWGKSSQGVVEGAYLWLVVRWVLGLHHIDNTLNGDSGVWVNNLQAKGASDDLVSQIISLADIQQFSTRYGPYNNQPSVGPIESKHWFLQVLPACTLDGRPPKHLAASPNGPGSLLKVGRVISHIIPSDHMRSEYNEPRSVKRSVFAPPYNEAPEDNGCVQDEKDLAYHCGHLVVHLDPVSYSE